MRPEPFELHRPSTVEEAQALASEHAGSHQYLAGGTDVIPNLALGLGTRSHVISLDRVDELTCLDLGAGTIGAMVRLRDLERSKPFPPGFRALQEAVRLVGTPLVRASATVGGNLLLDTRCVFFNQSPFWREGAGPCLKTEGPECHVVPKGDRCYSTFSSDLAPALIALDASVEISRASGKREVISLAQLYDQAGDGIARTHLRPGDLLTAVKVPHRASRSTYLKLRPRTSIDFPELSVAVALALDGRGVSYLRLVLGGIESHPLIFDDLTANLLGRPLAADEWASLASQVRDRVRPVNNTFFPADYRKQMAEVFVRKALVSLLSD